MEVLVAGAHRRPRLSSGRLTPDVMVPWRAGFMFVSGAFASRCAPRASGDAESVPYLAYSAKQGMESENGIICRIFFDGRERLGPHQFALRSTDGHW